MNNEILATAKFLAEDKDIATIIILDMVPSGCFDYGNKHALFLHEENGDFERFFDARYDKRFSTVQSFQQNAEAFVRDQLRDSLTITRLS